LYVDPLPMPEKTNSAMNPTKKSPSDFSLDATSTTEAAPAMATKFRNVVFAPPKLSAIQPPTGRMSEPISGPRKVR